MALLRLEDFDPHYRNRLGADVQSFDVFLNPQERVGRVVDIWVDEIGNIQNLTVDLGPQPGNKRVMLPFGESQIDRHNRRIYASGLSRAQIEQLSGGSHPVSMNPPAAAGHPAPVSQPVPTQAPAPSRPAPTSPPTAPSQPVYRVASLEESAPLEAPVEKPRKESRKAPKRSEESTAVNRTVPPSGQPPMSAPSLHPSPSASEPTVHYPSSTSAQSPSLYGAREYQEPTIAPPVAAAPVDSSSLYGAREYQEPTIAPQAAAAPAATSEVVGQQNIPLREERLVVDQHRQKIGEVVVRKEIETEIIEVPVQREKLVVEQVGEDDPLAEIDLHDRNRRI